MPNQLTNQRTNSIEKLIGPRLFKKFPASYGTGRFITAFTRDFHLSLPWAKSIQSMSPSLFLKNQPILCSHLCLGLPNGLFTSGSSTDTLYKSLLSPIRVTFSTHLILHDQITWQLSSEQCGSLSSTLTYTACLVYLASFRTCSNSNMSNVWNCNTGVLQFRENNASLLGYAICKSKMSTWRQWEIFIDRIPVGGEIFRTRPDRSWGPPSLLYHEHRVSFSEVKRPGRGVDHPSPSSTEVKERVELYFYSPSGPSWPVLGWTLPFTFTFTSTEFWRIPDYSLLFSNESFIWLRSLCSTKILSRCLSVFLLPCRCIRTFFFSCLFACPTGTHGLMGFCPASVALMRIHTVLFRISHILLTAVNNE